MQCSFIETVGSIEWALSDCHFLPSEMLSRDQSPGDWIDWIIDDLFGGAVKASIHVDQPDAPSPPIGSCDQRASELGLVKSSDASDFAHGVSGKSGLDPLPDSFT